ncbi:MAG TPA: asparaginase [Bacillales bacterium]|nr:asparaginase [Bacillales bacterium]
MTQPSAHGAIKVYRGDYVESTHAIHAAVVDRNGQLLYKYGDPERLTFARSSMKPFQAVPLIETGAAAHFGFTANDLALACASHNGEDFHRSGVHTMLERVGIGEDALQCGAHVPRDRKGYEKHILGGGDLTPVFSNCSGKHSGMLATAVYMKEDVDTYREMDHPVQQRILQVIAEVCDYPAEQIATSVDGCGVPVHRLPLANAAYGYARLAEPEGTKHAAALRKVREAMTAHPELVGGTRRFDTDVMKAYGGKVVAKVGAEGVQGIGIVGEGLGVLVKVEDGNERATKAAAMAVLKQLGVGSAETFAELEAYVEPPVYNVRKEKIGKIVADFTLERVQSS